MSRAKVKAQHCGNCGYNFRIEPGHDNFCPNCGQENHNPRRPIVHHFAEFVESWLHLDGKTWYTIKKLIFEPGRVSCDYIHNIRQRYTPPNRLFIFTLLVFVLVFEAAHDAMVKNEISAHATNSLSELMEQYDNGQRIYFQNPFFTGDKISFTVAQLKELQHLNQANIGYWLDQQGMKSWLVYRLEARMVKHNIESPLSVKEYSRHIVRVHYQVLLLMVPIGAFLIFIFFYRRDRMFYDALVTSVHLYVFGMIAAIVISLIALLLIRIGVLNDPTIVLPMVMVLGVAFNFIPAYKTVYGLSWSQTILRGLGVALSNMCIQILVFWLIAGLVG
jgi:hypothetical protein